MIGNETALGFLLSLIAFLRSEVGGRKSKDEILASISDQKTIQSYLEWLRRKDQERLISEIEDSKTQLVDELSGLRGQLDVLAKGVWQEAGDLKAVISSLNQRIFLPVLSERSLPTRHRANIPIKGRKTELQWLIDSTGDTLLYGQPGSGKTELLQEFIAKEKTGRFLISDNKDEVASAIIANPPSIVILDDAGGKRDFIIRLKHLRTERAIDFRIFAVCWPFDRMPIQQAMELSDTSTLEIAALSRKLIAEIITEIAITNKMSVSDDFIRVIAKQAQGMPGLAASLTIAALKAPPRDLVSGELLLNNLAPLLVEMVGDDAIPILGAFACGGPKGVSIPEVAKALEMPPRAVWTISERVALAGVLHQTGNETLCIQPGFLRSAVLKKAFFPSDGIPLPRSIWEALISGLKEPALGYLELIYARGRAEAAVSEEFLRKITAERNDSMLWCAMAWLSRSNCEWVLENTPTLTTEIKQAALNYCPNTIIPKLLELAAVETRRLNQHPDADMRILEDWVSGGWDDAFQRRRSLFDSAIVLLKSGNNVALALSAIRLSLFLEYHQNDSDPADPRTFRYKHGIVPLDTAKEVFKFWEELRMELSLMSTYPWRNITSIIDRWQHSGSMINNELPQGYEEYLVDSSRQMLADLLPLASDNQAALRWIMMKSKQLGMIIEPVPLSREFMILFPEEYHGEDWRQIESERVLDAQNLAEEWKDRPFSELIHDLVEWENQAAALDRVWPQMTTTLTSRLAEIRILNQEELSLAIRSLPPQVLDPLVDAAIQKGSITETHYQELLARPEHQGLLIQYALTGKTPELYAELELSMPRWEGLIESLCLRGQIGGAVLLRLLGHENRHLRSEVAFQMFRSDSQIPESLHEMWRKTIIESLVDLNNNRHHSELPYDLEKLLSYDQTIAGKVLEGILSSGDRIHSFREGRLLSLIISPLDKNERLTILQRSKHIAYSELPEIVVGRDPDLYRELLNIPELKGFYSGPLHGDPNDGNWTELAKIAVEAGISHADVALSVQGNGFSWSGKLSIYYQEWIERFESLKKIDDSDLQKIAEEGLKWAKECHESHIRSEKREEIYGWD